MSPKRRKCSCFSVSNRQKPSPRFSQTNRSSGCRSRVQELAHSLTSPHKTPLTRNPPPHPKKKKRKSCQNVLPIFLKSFRKGCKCTAVVRSHVSSPSSSAAAALPVPHTDRLLTRGLNRCESASPEPITDTHSDSVRSVQSQRGVPTWDPQVVG